MSVFDMPVQQRYPQVSRHPLKYYGLTKKRVKELEKVIQSGRYADIASYSAHRANEMIAEYILLSIRESKSYDALRVKWELREMEQIPYCRTDFYEIRRYAIHLFDLEMRRMGK